MDLEKKNETNGGVLGPDKKRARGGEERRVRGVFLKKPYHRERRKTGERERGDLVLRVTEIHIARARSTEVLGQKEVRSLLHYCRRMSIKGPITVG